MVSGPIWRPVVLCWGAVLKSAANWSLREGGFSTKYAPRFQSQVPRHCCFSGETLVTPRIGQG